MSTISGAIKLILQGATRQAPKAAAQAPVAAKQLAARVPQQGWIPIGDIIKRSPQGTLPRAARLMRTRPFEHVLADIEHATGLPVHSGFFRPLEDAKSAYAIPTAKWDTDSYKILKHVRRGRRELMTKYLMGTPNERVAAAQALTPTEVDKVKQLKANVFDPLFQQWFKQPSDRFLNDIVPRFRAANSTDAKAVFASGAAPQEVGLFELVGQGSMRNPLENDVARMTSSVIRAGFWREHVDSAYKQAQKFMYSKAIPEDLRPLLRTYLYGHEGRDAFVRNFGRLYKNIFKLVGHDVPEEDVVNVVNGAVALLHAGLLGLKPSAMMKNYLAGPMVSAPRIGNKWFLRGAHDAWTPQGKALFEASGIAEREQATILDKLNTITSGPVSGAAQRTARTLLTPYSRIDLKPRAQAFLGMHAKVEDAIRTMPRDALTSKDVNRFDDMFLRKSGMYRFHPVHQKQVRDLWRAGKFDEAAMRSGIIGQQDTQWVYRQGFRPQVMTSEAGRLLGQFGIWPINYMEYIGQMGRMIMYPEKWGIVPGYAKSVSNEGKRWAAEWMLNNMATIASISTVGATMGLGMESFANTLGWAATGPMFGGGPMLDLATSFDGMLYEMAVQRPGQNTSEFIQNMENFIPGTALLKEIMKARGETLRVIPPSVKKSKTYAPPRSTAEQAYRTFFGVQRKK